MQYRLVIEKNGKRARVVQVRSRVARLGRAHGNEVRIPSAEVSRRHCRISEQEGLLWIEDLESVNGTYLNGDMLTGRAVVRPGDRLQVGPVTFVVEYEVTPDALERLRELNSDSAEDGGKEAVEGAVLDVEEAEPEETPRRKPKRRARPAEEEEAAAEAEDVEEVEEVLEVDEYVPRADLDEVTWAPPGEGDLRDLLSHLDQGKESLLPRKRPGPRGGDEDEDDDWPADRRSGLEPPPRHKGKRRPEDEE